MGLSWVYWDRMVQLGSPIEFSQWGFSPLMLAHAPPPPPFPPGGQPGQAAEYFSWKTSQGVVLVEDSIYLIRRLFRRIPNPSIAGRSLPRRMFSWRIG